MKHHTAEELAQLFHETYERLAPEFDYKTREASAKPWADVPETNKKLMIAVCAEILDTEVVPLKREIQVAHNVLLTELGRPCAIGEQRLCAICQEVAAAPAPVCTETF